MSGDMWALFVLVCMALGFYCAARMFLPRLNTLESSNHDLACEIQRLEAALEEKNSSKTPEKPEKPAVDPNSWIFDDMAEWFKRAAKEKDAYTKRAVTAELYAKTYRRDLDFANKTINRMQDEAARKAVDGHSHSLCKVMAGLDRTLQMNLDAAKEELTAANKKILRLETTAARAPRQIEPLKQEIEKLKKGLEAAARAPSQVEPLKQEIETLKKSLGALQKSSTADADSFKTAREFQKREWDMMQEERNDMQMKLNEMMTSQKIEVKKQKEAQRESEETTRKLRDELETAKKNLTEMTSKMKKAATEYESKLPRDQTKKTDTDGEPKATSIDKETPAVSQPLDQAIKPPGPTPAIQSQETAAEKKAREHGLHVIVLQNTAARYATTIQKLRIAFDYQLARKREVLVPVKEEEAKDPINIAKRLVISEAKLLMLEITVVALTNKMEMILYPNVNVRNEKELPRDPKLLVTQAVASIKKEEEWTKQIGDSIVGLNVCQGRAGAAQLEKLQAEISEYGKVQQHRLSTLKAARPTKL